MKKEKYLVGTYRIGMRPVRLYVLPESEDGSVYVTPKDGGSTIVNIGIDNPWHEALSVFLHESYEIGLIDLNTRYRTSPSYTDEASDFLFIATHNQLSEVHERVGSFLSLALTPFTKAYKKYKKKKIVKRNKR